MASSGLPLLFFSSAILRQTLDLIDSVPRSVESSGGEESAAAEGEGEGKGEGSATALEATSGGGSGSLESEVSVAIGALLWRRIGLSTSLRLPILFLLVLVTGCARASGYTASV